ncbi:MAG: BMP family protein [SAR324 cluster bacterium]|nr:BMP family protein [SAR324 cluster bacterium]
MRISIFFVGELHDTGFNSCALAGAEKASANGLAEIEIISGIPYDQEKILGKLRTSMSSTDGVVFIGGQGDISMPVVAGEFPDKRFAIVQGQKTGPNLSSYDVRQEDSAFLAGCLAARLTQSGIVSHLSGHRVRPGLKGRAAFVGGVIQTNAEVKILTSFCGTQDDNVITNRWALSQISNGADIIFTMLNGARQGVIEACGTSNVRQIGNALDWCSMRPDIFVASAIARIDLGVEQAIADMVNENTPQNIVEFGLAEGNYASLSMLDSTPSDLVAEIDEISSAIRAGEIAIPTEYDGPEFDLEPVPCS